ncbi:VanZ family protein [Neobacillus dielmonensis]|uniref:VanZ family protein n=1 Tax=Neobacillus dielmonensis TaxID=1347369 RepID=UPI0005AB29D5|nr:VanZ family protein [Neobacillus dielmonensis]
MKSVTILIWMLLIFVLTCTASFSELLAYGEVQFHWESHPDLADLFTPMPEQVSNGFVKQKIGHSFAFFVFALLLQRKKQSKILIFVVATTYAMFTEILQLFFTRDGRLFDIGFDLAGIIMALSMQYLAPKSRQFDIRGQ